MRHTVAPHNPPPPSAHDPVRSPRGPDVFNGPMRDRRDPPHAKRAVLPGRRAPRYSSPLRVSRGT